MALNLKEKQSTLKETSPKPQKFNKPKNNKDDNVVFVGEKPLSNYLKTVKLLFFKKNLKTIIIRSRGRHITKAVDLAEITKRIIEGITSTQVEIASESFKTKDKDINISTIDITLSK